MLKTVLLSLLAILVLGVALVLILAARRPDGFTISRSALIAAPPEKIYPFLADFSRWTGWSPWERKDPAMERRLTGPQSGVGAAYAWRGNGNVGEGRMEIVEAAAPGRLRLDLDFVKPFAAHNQVVFTLVPKGPATEVTWTMSGPTPLLAKVMHLFFDMEKMVGPDFESGLASLKAQAER